MAAKPDERRRQHHSQGNDGVQLTIEPRDDLRPGFYTISGRIIQTAG